MTEVDRRSCMACLAAVEANLAELRGTPGWWALLSDANRLDFAEFEAQVRAYSHQLGNPRV